jgi:hypothetical protein
VLVLALAAYWLTYVLVAPVTTTDGQLYNQARLYVIRQGGLLGNRLAAQWTQIAFPWSFDATHWPFLRLGFGMALPSFACFAGVLVVVFVHVRALLGRDGAWLCVLTLLAMPTLVYQGTSTKNDMAVVFGVVVWWHALRGFGAERRWLQLFASATAIAFTGGAKTSGLPLAAAMTLVSLWALRRTPRMLGAWLLALALAGMLLLSAETYVASARLFGHPLGPHGLVGLRNADGVAGAAANAIRHVFGNVDLGLDQLLGVESSVTTRLEAACRAALDAAGLRNRGHSTLSDDRQLDFYKTGREAADGYGPVGTLAMFSVPVLLMAAPPATWPWRLAAGAVASFGLVSWTTGYASYQNRLLVLPFTLAGVAAALAVWPWWARWRAVRGFGLLLLFHGAVVLPLCSFNRGPADLWSALRDRDRMALKEAPHLLPVLEAVRAALAECPESRWVIVPRAMSWELVWYQTLGDRAVIVPRSGVDAQTLAELSAERDGRPVFVLALGQGLRGVPSLVQLGSFAESSTMLNNTRLYRYGPSGCEPSPSGPERDAQAPDTRQMRRRGPGRESVAAPTSGAKLRSNGS